MLCTHTFNEKCKSNLHQVLFQRRLHRHEATVLAERKTAREAELQSLHHVRGERARCGELVWVIELNMASDKPTLTLNKWDPWHW